MATAVRLDVGFAIGCDVTFQLNSGRFSSGNRTSGGSIETRRKIDSDAYKLKYCTDAGMEAVTDKDSNGVAKNYVKSSTDLKNALADVDVIIDQTYDSDPATNLDTQEKVLKNLGITLKQGAVLLRLADSERSRGRLRGNSKYAALTTLRPLR